jgi:23S rRNA pseudouridine1911/1915/1917 synthase
MEQIDLIVDASVAGERLDKAVSLLCENISRSSAQTLIEDGNILVNNKIANKKTSLKEGDCVTINLPEPKELDVTPENIP